MAVGAILNDAVASRLVSALQTMGFEVYLGPSREVVPNADVPRVREIQQAVCDRCNISLAEMMNIRRQGVLCKPRHLAMWLAVECTSFSSVEIGRCFGRDHSTVLYAHKRVNSLWKITEPALWAIGEELRTRFRGENSASYPSYPRSPRFPQPGPIGDHPSQV